MLPLVAGLFVLVESLDENRIDHARTGPRLSCSTWFAQIVRLRGGLGRRALVLAAGCNLVNNLPAGLIAGSAVEGAHVPEAVTGAILVGVDVGPNLSVTGSLATILWLTALKREGISVSAWQFLRLGALVMPPALLLSLAGLILTH